MSLFEALYGRKCKVPSSLDNLVEKVTLGDELLKEMDQAMVQMRKNLKIAQDRQKSYTDSKRTPREFKIGDHVYLQVKPKRISLKMGMCTKLDPQYYGPFEILERIGPITYIISLPPTIRAHNVFHMSLLKKYVHDSNHIIDWTIIQVEPKGEFQPEPQCILDKKETILRN
jgi:hypothetical protein